MSELTSTTVKTEAAATDAKALAAPRTCPKCMKNELAPRCRVCDECLTVRTSPVVMAAESVAQVAASVEQADAQPVAQAPKPRAPRKSRAKTSS
jgi:hypothetical protein